MIKLVRAGAAAPAEEIVVDNSAATVVGTWTASTNRDPGDYWGGDWIYHAAGSGANSVTWTPAIPAAGRYTVFARWTKHTNRATNAPYTVHHAGGQTTVPVNQELSGGIWVPLGAFDFAPGQGHKVVLTDNANEYVVADAVKLVRDAGAGLDGIVVDNLAATRVGAWTATAGAPGYWGSEFHYSAAGTGADTITWTPALTQTGQYRVYARWTYNANRATNAPYTVHHAGGSTTIRVNQEQNGGEWVPLGSFDLAPGQNHRVVLSDDANEYVIGDAINFVLETNARAVVADATKIVGESAPAGAFAATSSSLTREYVTLDGRPLALIENGQINYVHPDHLGTPQKMTDATGALIWDAVYKPFGEAEQISGSATNPQRFPGQVYDPETGLHYNYFRDYAPGLGRYVESDPIGLLGGLTTYAYVRGNPLLASDPLGLKATGVWEKTPHLVDPSVDFDGWRLLDIGEWHWDVYTYWYVARTYWTISGAVVGDIKCKDDCDEWPINISISVTKSGHVDLGPNIVAVIVGTRAGLLSGIAANIIILVGKGAINLYEIYAKYGRRGLFIIGTLLDYGPTYICNVGPPPI